MYAYNTYYTDALTPTLQLAVLLWVVARCRVPLPDDSRDVFADAIFSRLGGFSRGTLFSVATALAVLGNR